MKVSNNNKYVRLSGDYFDKTALDAALDALGFHTDRANIYGFLLSNHSNRNMRLQFVPKTTSLTLCVDPSPDWFTANKAKVYKISKPADF